MSAESLTESEPEADTEVSGSPRWSGRLPTSLDEIDARRKRTRFKMRMLTCMELFLIYPVFTVSPFAAVALMVSGFFFSGMSVLDWINVILLVAAFAFSILLMLQVAKSKRILVNEDRILLAERKFQERNRV